MSKMVGMASGVSLDSSDHGRTQQEYRNFDKVKEAREQVLNVLNVGDVGDVGQVDTVG